MAKIDKILGSISPLYGAVSGQGLFGSIQNALGPAAGILSQATRARREGNAAKRNRAAWDEENGFAPAAGAGSGMKRGGKVKKYAKGGSASKRADGCATKGKTKGRFV